MPCHSPGSRPYSYEHFSSGWAVTAAGDHGWGGHRHIPPHVSADEIFEFKEDGRVERVKGIEPSYAAWEAAVLPLNYTRIRDADPIINGQSPRNRDPQAVAKTLQPDRVDFCPIM